MQLSAEAMGLETHTLGSSVEPFRENSGALSLLSACSQTADAAGQGTVVGSTGTRLAPHPASKGPER